MYKIVIAEDNPIMRRGLALICETLGLFVLFLANDGQQLEDYLAACETGSDLFPDIILMDISMPVINGITATTFITMHFPRIRVIALSLFSQEKLIIDMLRSGAWGYLTKNDAEPEEIRSAIDAVMNHELYLSPTVLKEWRIPSDYLKPGYHNNYKTSLLNEREYEFLSFCGTGMEYKEIAAKMKVKLSTINSYSYNVFEKLDIHTRAGLAAYAIKHGLTDIYLPEY
jgi:DNA-binding NarL/FixJ family response regulator